MNLAKDQICTHISNLTKQVLKNTFSIKLNQLCKNHTNIPTYYLCLHCGAQLCLDYVGSRTCLQDHFLQNQNHYFAVQIEYGSIWCVKCDDSIQNMLFVQNNNNQQSKLFRFCNYILELWEKNINCLKIKKIVLRKGLKNLGNTCFLNSVLQCLSSDQRLLELYKEIQIIGQKLTLNRKIIPKQIEYFYDELIEKKESQQWNIVSSKKDKQKTNQIRHSFRKSIKNSKFSITLKSFLKEMSQQQSSSLSPISILDFISQIDPRYRLKQQQDAQQLLLILIDLVCQGERLSFLKQQERYQLIEKYIGYQKLSPTQNIFAFYLLDQIQCNNCKKITTNLNLNYNIAINPFCEKNQEENIERNSEKVDMQYWEQLFYPNVSNDLPKLVQNFFSYQRLTQLKNYYSCEKCKSLVAIRKYYLVSPPQTLIITVKRFNASLTKSNNYVQFPQTLNLQSVTMNKQPSRYTLKSVIVHTGTSISTGHYISYILLKNQWYLCSDQKVQAVSWQMVKTQQAYILFYSREQ